jgi:hypothetical protein
LGELHPLKPLYGQFADAPGVGPFHDSEEAMAYCLDAPLLERIVTVNDDVAAAQLGRAARRTQNRRSRVRGTGVRRRFAEQTRPGSHGSRTEKRN